MRLLFLIALGQLLGDGPVLSSPTTRPAAAGCAATLQGGAFPVDDWTAEGFAGAAAPTVTANAAAGPPCSGNTGAARAVLAATDASQYSALRNLSTSSSNFLCPATGGAKSVACWVKATAAATFDFCWLTPAWECHDVNATTSWQFVKFENMNWPAGCVADNCQFLIGNGSLVNSGTVARNASTIFLDNCRCVEGASISQ